MSSHPPSDSKSPPIPVRTSSKIDATLEAQLVEKKRECKRQKRPRPKSSHDSEFWSSFAEYKRLEHECTQLRRKISIRDFEKQDNRAGERWQDTEEGKRIIEQIRAEQAEIKILDNQAIRTDDGPPQRKLRRVFLKMFTSSRLGLNLGLSQGGRDDSVQSNFRSDLLKAYDSAHPKKHWLHWCPIMCGWRDEVRASHIFPHRYGKDTMAILFGDSVKDEMFSTKNGLILDYHVEKLFEAGFFVIVPDVPDDCTEQSIRVWNETEPKEYKLRIINRQHEKANEKINQDREETWMDWDGKKLEFRNNFRPRARYLYFHYCCQMLRYAWGKDPKSGDEQPTPLRKELQKAYWGTPGRYLPEAMLTALIDEMGHEYEPLLKGARKESGGSRRSKLEDNVLLGALAGHIAGAGEPSSEEDSDSDDEDENEDPSVVGD